VEEPELALELTWNVEVEVEDLDITRIAHKFKVVVSKIKEEGSGGLELDK